MQAITYQDPFKVIVKTVDIPKLIEPTDVIVKIIASGLCGSDLHIYRENERGLDKGTIMGHEFVGIIHEIGDAVTTLSIGDRVFSPFTTSCDNCFYCKRGITCRCEKGNLYGWISKGKGIQGAQAEYIRVPLASTTLVKVPQDINDNVALLLGDVLSTGYFCAQNGLGHEFSDNDVVVVIGCGPVGLMAIAATIFLGAKSVYAIDCVEERLKIAQEFGANIINFVECDPLNKIKELTDGRALELAFNILRTSGVISSVGVHNSTTFPFSPARCPVKHILTKSIPLALSKKFDFEKIITHTLKLSDGEKAYNIFDKKLDGCIKVVFKI
ncbi:20754_t:CDS:2 [Rhizophagus irregularis]|nr:20754_t:CDS:2 [Rhizophagus irregularis]